MKRWMASLAVATTLSLPAYAGGFFIPEQGSKAVGIGNAFTGLADDASANWYNPAGLAFVPNSVAGSTDLIMPVNQYLKNNQTYTAKKPTFVVPQLYARYGLEGKPVSLGLGVNAPFGLSTDWTNSNAPFSQTTAGPDGVTFSQIEAIHTNLNAAWHISEHLSVAVGGSYYRVTKVHLDNALLQIKGDGDGFGANLALFYRNEDVSLGLSYRSRVKLTIDGLATGLSPLPPTFRGMSEGAHTSITLPDIVMAGAAWRVHPDWLIAVQIDWINWKTFDAINLRFDPSLLNIVTGTSKSVPENWKATTTIRLGAEWSYSPTNRVRLGYVYDPTPTNDRDLSPRLPGNDRQLITLGWGMDVSRAFTVDLAYAYVWLKDRNLTTARTAIYNGVYKSYVHILSAGVNYRF